MGEPASEGKALTRVAPFELTAADGAYTGKRLKYDKSTGDYVTDGNDVPIDNPSKLSYYLAVDITDCYDGLPLESDLEHGETSTIKVQKGGGELEFTVHDGILTADQYYKEDTPVLVKRTAGKLYVVDGPCPEDVEEEEEDEEEEEPE